MSISGIGGAGSSASALAALRLALRQTQPGSAAPAAPTAAPAAAAAPPATPDAALQDVVARAQFTTSLRIASAAVEQVGVAAQSYDPPALAPE